MSSIERRDYELKAIEVRGTEAGSTIFGIAAPYGVLSDEIRSNGKVFREQISPGAFDQSISQGDIFALAYHDKTKILGRTANNTLSVRSVAGGLEYEITLPNTSYANDLKELIKRGDVSSCSFGFVAIDDSWDKRSNPQIRTLRKVDLLEISMVSDPAYPTGTSVALRQRQQSSLSAAGRSSRLFSFLSFRHPPRS